MQIFYWVLPVEVDHMHCSDHAVRWSRCGTWRCCGSLVLAPASLAKNTWVSPTLPCP